MKRNLFLIGMAGSALTATQPALAQRGAAPVGAQAPQPSPAQLDRYVGYYQLTRYLTLHVYRLGDKLHSEFSDAGRNDVKLVPMGDASFNAPADTRPLWGINGVDRRQASSRITFTVDAGGNATGLVLRVGGKDWPAPKIERDKAFHIEWQRRVRVGRQIPSGTREFLDRFLRSVETGAPDYSEMTPKLAAEQKRDHLAARIRSWGPVQKVYFVVVTDGGSDRYTVDFPNSQMDFLIEPVDADGKVPELMLRPSIPPGFSTTVARYDQVGRGFIGTFPPAPIPFR